MRIFKYKWFHRFAKKEGISDSELKEIVNQLEGGQYYADLGGSVYKMELARKGKGKRGGYRVLVIFKSEFRTFFAFGFPKSKMGNIEDDMLKGYKKQAKEDFSLTEEQIKLMLEIKDLVEILQEE
ncbi:MAG: type II toxin-antitoxin system RelE/ParE family toxin [Treponema sp.]|nr:type II toxin-antitoxin system RelE/ParE family toxin [Treponema sp.]